MTKVQVWSRNIPLPVEIDEKEPIAHPSPCPDCEGIMFLHKTGNGYWFRCSNPGCNGNVSADTVGRPLGIPIDKKGRALRAKAHDLLDPLWLRTHGNDMQSKYAVRTELYKYLQLVLDVDDFHIGLLSHEKLEKLIELLKGDSVQRYMIYGLGITPREGDTHETEKTN